jgi:hypothetical protein
MHHRRIVVANFVERYAWISSVYPEITADGPRRRSLEVVGFSSALCYPSNPNISRAACRIAHAIGHATVRDNNIVLPYVRMARLKDHTDIC